MTDSRIASRPDSSDGLLRRDKLFIGGKWTDPVDGSIERSIDPASGKPWAMVAFGGPKDIDRAVRAAREALQGPWGKASALERGALLRRLADLYQAHAPEMAALESRDSGRAIRESRVDVGAHHQWYRWFASLAETRSGRTVPIDDSV